MKTTLSSRLGITLAGVLALAGGSVNADTFGSGANVFTIDFVNIGNAGNGDDLGAGGGIYSSPYGGVAYDYRMGTYEVSRNQIDKAVAGGLLNVAAAFTTGAKSAVDITWFEAAAFVNFLNTRTGHQPAYQLDASATVLTLWAAGEAWDNDPGTGVELNRYRHKNAYYFLPSEDEWYKAAYHKNDGATANYWDYATGGNTAPVPVSGGSTPGTAVYAAPGGGSFLSIADVTLAGGLSPYLTMGQDGNVWEQLETDLDGVNDGNENQALRGGAYGEAEEKLRASFRKGKDPYDSNPDQGFRVASIVPEPSSALLLLGSGWLWLAGRRRRVS